MTSIDWMCFSLAIFLNRAANAAEIDNVVRTDFPPKEPIPFDSPDFIAPRDVDLCIRDIMLHITEECNPLILTGHRCVRSVELLTS